MIGQLASTSTLLQDERSGMFSSPSNRSNIKHLGDRSTVVDWIVYANSERFRLHASTLLRAFNILDAYLGRSSLGIQSRQDMAILAIACLHLAGSYDIRLHGIDVYTQLLPPDYDIDKIKDVQDKVFKTLGCSISMPTEYDFLQVISAHLELPPRVMTMARDLLLASAIKGSPYLPSVRTAACVAIANRVITPRKTTNNLDIPDQVVESCATEIVENIRSLDSSQLPGIELLRKKWGRFKPWSGFVDRAARAEKRPYLCATYFKPSIEITLIPTEAIPDGSPFLGKGAFGTVRRVAYKGGVYAVKTTIDDEDGDEFLPVSFIREVSIMQSLDHPNVVPIYHITSDLRSIFVELGSGDLYAWLYKEGPLSNFEQINIASQMLSALVYIHSCGVIHRDIKSGNIIVYPGRKITYKLGDFGGSRGCDIPFNKGMEYTSGVGTLFYRAPEIVLDDTSYGDKIDVWSMACTLYECVTGKILFYVENDVESTDKIENLARTSIDDDIDQHDTSGDKAVELDLTLLNKIYKLLGTPTEETWPDMPELPFDGVIEQYDIPDNPFEGMGLSLLYHGILEDALVLDPNQRRSASEINGYLEDLIADGEIEDPRDA